jgi:hypothetical protein
MIERKDEGEGYYESNQNIRGYVMRRRGGEDKRAIGVQGFKLRRGVT